MPALKNAKHERFAQARAAGATIDQAYADAGFSPHRGNAHRLSAKESVRERVRELLTEASAAVGVTLETVTRDLMEDRDLARKHNQASAAIKATEHIAKLHGVYVERTETTHSGEVVTSIERIIREPDARD